MTGFTGFEQIPDQDSVVLVPHLLQEDSNPEPAYAQPAPQTENPASGPERKNSGRFRPGQSGNPSGRPKRTQEEKDTLEEIRRLGPMAVKQMEKILASEKITPMKVRVIEIVLERIYGKAETAVKVTSAAEAVEESEEYIMALVESIREDMKNE